MSPPAPSPPSSSGALNPGAADALRCLVGPTAVGKSALALALCERTGAEIASLDSMQVYRGMDIGTAKPTPAERARVRHHLIDVVAPSERYDVRRWLDDAQALVADARARGVRLLFVGGTGFYLAALVRGLFDGPPADLALRAELAAEARARGNEALHAELSAVDPRAAARIHANDTKRLVRALEVARATGRPLSDWQSQWGSGAERPAVIAGLELATDELDRRIAARTAAMLDAGWVEEALAVRAGPGFGPTAAEALGYREVLAFADGALDRATCEASIAQATRRFARRQRTWLRKFDVLALAAPERGGLAARVDELARAYGWS